MIIDRAYMDSLNDLALFRLAKHILKGEMEYPLLQLDYDEIPDRNTGVPERRLWGFANPRDLRPIEIVDPGELNGVSCAEGGFFAFGVGDVVRMAILNCDVIHRDVFDESAVRGMLLGPRVSEIRDDILAYCPRYVHVSEANTHFSADHHVLYSKDRKILYRYAPARPETEFRVPPTVKELCNCAFMGAFNLQTLYLPRRIRMHDSNSSLGWAYIPKNVAIHYYDPA